MSGVNGDRLSITNVEDILLTYLYCNIMIFDYTSNYLENSEVCVVSILPLVHFAVVRWMFLYKLGYCLLYKFKVRFYFVGRSSFSKFKRSRDCSWFDNLETRFGKDSLN